VQSLHAGTVTLQQGERTVTTEENLHIEYVQQATADMWKSLLMRNTEPHTFEGFRSFSRSTGKTVVVIAPNGEEIFRYPESR